MSPRTDLAHLLRRATFGPTKEQLAEFDSVALTTVVDRLLAAPPMKVTDPPSFTVKDSPLGPGAWWMRQIGRPEASLHERMVWFWHGHLTTSIDKIGSPKMMWQQHQLIRQHALGNFRALLQSITIDPAMLLYLDGGSSVATAPNENYGREVMELFALGRNQYTQSDVHSAALSLAGWTVDYEQATSAFDAARGYPRPVEFLGKHGRLTAKDVIDIICDHPHCAMHVAGRIYYHLVGAEPTPEIATRLGQVMRSHNLAIAPVVAEILKDPTFMGSAMQRPRSPVEWVTAAVRAMELPDDGDPNQGADPTRRFQWSQLLGQTPFAPPNVAGWPDGSQWLNAGYALERERLALNAKPLDTIIQAEDPVTAALEQCALFTVSPSTRSALQSIVANVRDFTVQSRLLLAATIASPEFALS